MNQIKLKDKILKFIYPFYPHHLFNSIKLMMVLAMLITVRIILGFISIPIPGVGISISIAWVPLMIIGWIYGPIYGFIVGMITDTIGFLISPTAVWFWMYAIQEPLVGLVSGIFQGAYYLRINNKKANITFDILFEQVTIMVFSLVGLILLLLWVDHGNIKYFSVYKSITIGLLCFYLLVIEIFTLIFTVKSKNNKKYLITFIYSSVLVTLIGVIFSFLLGPISAVEYLYYINGVYPDNYLQYGIIFYLIPRIITESIKTPIEAIVLTGSIFVINPNIEKIKNFLNNQY